MALRRSALATPDLRRLQLAWAAASVGGWTFMVALAVHAYAVGGAAAVGLAALVRMAPAGPRRAADGARRRSLPAPRRPARRDDRPRGAARRRGGRGGGERAVRARPDAGRAVHRRLGRPQAGPGRAAPAPHARSRPANALASSIDNAAFIVGAVAAGVLVATLGAAVAFAAAGAAFAVAAILIATQGRPATFARLPKAGVAPAGSRRSPACGWWRSDRRLRLLVGVLSASTLVEGMVDVLVVVDRARADRPRRRRRRLAERGLGRRRAGGRRGRALARRPRVPAPGAAHGRPADRAGADRARLASAPRGGAGPAARARDRLLAGGGRGDHAAAAAGARPRPRPRVRRRREFLLADDRRGRDAGAARRRASPARAAR